MIVQQKHNFLEILILLAQVELKKSRETGPLWE